MVLMLMLYRYNTAHGNKFSREISMHKQVYDFIREEIQKELILLYWACFTLIACYFLPGSFKPLFAFTVQG